MSSASSKADSLEAQVALRSSSAEKERRRELAELFERLPLDSATLIYSQLSLFQSRQDLARVLLLAQLYERYVLKAPGVVMEFGTFLGRNAALFSNLRAIYEPYNFTRRIISFDTFNGLTGVAPQDGQADIAQSGKYSVARRDEDYVSYLDRILTLHESAAPLDHITKHELVRGDVRETAGQYFITHPETVVALAYFDLDLYEPTVAALRAVQPYLTRSSLLVFDEPNCPEFPGETIAVREVFGLNGMQLQRSPLHPWIAYTQADFLVPKL